MGVRIDAVRKRTSTNNNGSFSKIRKHKSPNSLNSLANSILHLQKTIGNRAVQRMIETGVLQVMCKTHFSVKAAGSNATQKTGPANGKTVGSSVAGLISRSHSGSTLPENIRRELAELSGDELTDVRVHNDHAAHKAAEQLGAHAFTIGRSIYFGANQYQPSSSQGKQLLAHEAGHTIQQQKAAVPLLQNLPVNSVSDEYETEADRFAHAAVNKKVNASLFMPITLTPLPMAARIQRQIHFTRSNDTFRTNNMGVRAVANGFQIFETANPIFQWEADVTINGHAGDPCNRFEPGSLQLVRSYYHNVWWGTNNNRTHRRCFLRRLPIRDAMAAGNTWNDDLTVRPFTACGQTLRPDLEDSPQSRLHTWNNPVARRHSTRGWFNYGVSFVTYKRPRYAPGPI